MDASTILRLRESTAASPTVTNSSSQRWKNRKVIDETLRKAEEIRCKTAALGRAWKHNAEHLKQERDMRRAAEQQMMSEYKASDRKIRELHHFLDATVDDTTVLVSQGNILERSVELYQARIKGHLALVEGLRQELAAVNFARDEIVRSITDVVAEMKVKALRMESVVKRLDDDIESATAENTRLKLELGLSGR